MNKLLTKISAIALVTGMMGMTGAWQSAVAAPSGIDFATYTGPDRNELLVAAAKKEGEVSVYQAYPALSVVEAAFTKKYGIKVKSWRADSETILQRVVTEARGGRNEVDIVQNNSPEQEGLHREKLLQEVKSPYLADMIPEAFPTHREWVGLTQDIWIAAYNSEKVKKEDLPKTYEDLLDPKWKGRLAVEANDYAWFGNLVAAMGDQKARKLFADLVANNGMSFRKGHSLLAALIASGEVPIGLSVYSWSVAPLKKKGAPIEPLLLQPVLAEFSALAMIKKAPHPAAAVLFYDFLFSEGQQILSDLYFIPASKKIKHAFTGVPIKYIDPGLAIDSQDKNKKVYDDVLLKNAK
ncbi:MAG TPA: extracellular solute-binding protein [Herbaspirillum sp.]|jgi:iron(III) transport system substrate-binding protein